MKKIRIMIVENDEDEQTFMKEGFQNSGCFEVVAAMGSVEELLDLLDTDSNNLPDLVFSDLNMPGKNGYDLIKSLRSDSRFSAVPIILTSTSSIKSVRDTCIELGALKFVQKPDTFTEYENLAKDLAQLL